MGGWKEFWQHGTVNGRDATHVVSYLICSLSTFILSLFGESYLGSICGSIS